MLDRKFDPKGRFIIENYNRCPAFSSFLPGISGLHGIPAWCFYVNRGQAVTSFGLKDKNHSIMEFYPAQQAYRFTGTMGFRTFLKADGRFYEPFCSDEARVKMYIGRNELEIEERIEDLGLQINVLYYTLPNEPIGGLVRTVTVQNLLEREQDIELLDGMPAVIPYGIALPDLKEMAQTMTAWMQAEDIGDRLPYYRVRFSTKDSAVVSKVESGNFMLSVTKRGERLPVIVAPELVFSYDTALKKPVGFLTRGAKSLTCARQIAQNQVPCGFSCLRERLLGKEKLSLYTIVGQAGNKEILRRFAQKKTDAGYFEEKHREAVRITEELCRAIETKSADPVFDAYCKQTFLDNVLRGGYPILLGDKVFYVYSRKHGDIERDYNFFTMLPEYYSQGNGNYRDVNQNRRSDVLFAPFVREHNIRTFYNLIQLDGYNPLSVKQATYRLSMDDELSRLLPEQDREKIKRFFEREFSPGSLLLFLEREEIGLTCGRDAFLEAVMEKSLEIQNAEFGEGYWTDHWTYNLDLAESYLAVYPEREEALLYEEREYTYYDSGVAVRPRTERYERTERGVRQYHALNEERKAAAGGFARTRYGKGEVYKSTLMAKLLVLAVNKMACLDMSGMGIEMEAGKPGWYDALNGLPGIFGSSMAESLELKRLLGFMLEKTQEYGRAVRIPIEASRFLSGLNETLLKYRDKGRDRLWVWNRFNLHKEEYRKATLPGVSGEEADIGCPALLEALKEWESYLGEGIRMAMERTGGLVPTYFTYRFDGYTEKEGEIIPEHLEIRDMPLFLEGPVRYMRLPYKKEKKRELYLGIKATGLYDPMLNMYKVNESLEKADYEAGRAKAFSPGWLENESVWLHMEYKYLLELLKSGLYREFFEDFGRAAVPFLSYETYGRSPLENCSFLASSANADQKLHGRGFVARLSGSTAEFLQIWQIMMFGEKPFHMRQGGLAFKPKPALPAYLIPEDKKLSCTLLGSTKVVYQFGRKTDVLPGCYHISEYKITYTAGETECVRAAVLDEARAVKLRNKEAQELRILVDM